MSSTAGEMGTLTSSLVTACEKTSGKTALEQDPWLYKVPGFYMVNGVVMGDSSPAEYLQDVRNMPLFDDDVFVISYPKSGTTMLQEMVWLIRTNGDLDSANQTSTFHRVPFCDYVFPPDDNGLKNADEAPRPRIIKTHLPFKMAPKEIMDKQVKALYVMRNPKDVLVSYYYFYKSTVTFGRFPGTWNEFFEMFLAGNIYWGTVLDHVIGWWEVRDAPNVKMLTYEDLVTNSGANVRDIAQFLGVKLTDDVVEKIVRATEFKTMQTNPATNAKNLVEEIDYKISPFMRKGIIGDWKNHFSPEQNRIMDELIAEKYGRTGMKFVYELGQSPK